MFNTPPQGWQCPVCKTVYAPTVTECKCAANARVRIYSTDGQWIRTPPTMTPNDWYHQETVTAPANQFGLFGAVTPPTPDYVWVDTSDVWEEVALDDNETPLGATWEEVSNGKYRLRIRYKREQPRIHLSFDGHLDQE